VLHLVKLVIQFEIQILLLELFIIPKELEFCLEVGLQFEFKTLELPYDEEPLRRISKGLAKQSCIPIQYP